MKNNNRTSMKPTMKNKNEKTTIVQKSYNNRSKMKTNETHQRKTKIKHNTEKQHWNTLMTHSIEKQQSYYKEKTMKHKNEKTTIVQQLYNIRTAKETMKNEN